CPADHASTNCSRLEERTGKVNYRFEWNNNLCQTCTHRHRCLSANATHRTLLVSQYHEHTQARRREVKTESFKKEMHPRNGIKGTIRELKRGHGPSQWRYRGFITAELRSYLIGAACNIKRWSRRLAWEFENGGGPERGMLPA